MLRRSPSIITVSEQDVLELKAVVERRKIAQAQQAAQLQSRAKAPVRQMMDPEGMMKAKVTSDVASAVEDAQRRRGMGGRGGGGAGAGAGRI